MNSIIAAHLPDFETWQTSCLLFDELPCFFQQNILSLFDKIIYNHSTHHVITSENEIQIKFDKYLLVIQHYLKQQNLYKIVEFDYDGNIYEKYSLINGLYHGRYVKYYPDGKINILCYYDHGKLNGKYFEYGNISIEGNYLNGQKHGRYIRYNRNGDIIVDEIYEHGIKIVS